MLKAGKKANALGHPVVLDPVGAGASTLRTETAYRLLDEVLDQFLAVRGCCLLIVKVHPDVGTND